MRKAYISIASLLLFGSVLMAQSPANRTAKTIAADVLAQMPAEKQAEYNKMINDLKGTGEEGVLMLVNMINAPGKGSNAQVDYALSGLTHYVMAKGEESARLATANAYLKALDLVTERETKAFIIRQLQILGQDECIDALSAYLGDESLSGPASRALAAIGSENAGKALKAGLMRRMGTPKTQTDIIVAIGPVDDDFTQGGLQFVDEVKGGNIPKEFIPSVQKGFQTAMKNGVLAGYPLDSLKVVLKDGSFHPVDSDQLSFEICAIQAYKNACAKAGPVLTEPIMKLEVVTPEENMGDVIGDLNKRRGQVEGMESSRSGARIVKAKVPLAEMFGYVTALRTITSGRATSSMTYDHHAQVSSSIAKTVLEEVKGRVDLV